MLSLHVEDARGAGRSHRRAAASEPSLCMNLNKGNEEFAKTGTFQLKRLTVGLDRTTEHHEDVSSHLCLWL